MARRGFRPTNVTLDELNTGTVELTGKGDIWTYNGTEIVRQAAGADGEYLIWDSAEPTGIRSAVATSGTLNDLNAGAVELTAPGDLWTFDGAAVTKQAVGADETFLIYDSTQPNGIRTGNDPDAIATDSLTEKTASGGLSLNGATQVYSTGEMVFPAASFNNNIRIATTQDPLIADGFANVYIGSRAGFSMNLATPDNNVIIGDHQFDTAGDGGGNRNVHLGYSAGQASFSNDSVSIGTRAGSKMDIGDRNINIGTDAGGRLTATTYSGSDNIFMGHFAGSEIETGDGNISIGANSGISLTTGNFNTSVGFGAGEDLTVGTLNTFLGYQSGQNIITGSDNVFIGNAAGTGSGDVAGRLIIRVGGNDIIFGNGATNTVVAGGVTLANGVIGAGLQLTSQVNIDSATVYATPTTVNIDSTNKRQLVLESAADDAFQWTGLYATAGSLVGQTTGDFIISEGISAASEEQRLFISTTVGHVYSDFNVIDSAAPELRVGVGGPGSGTPTTFVRVGKVTGNNQFVSGSIAGDSVFSSSDGRMIFSPAGTTNFPLILNSAGAQTIQAGLNVNNPGGGPSQLELTTSGSDSGLIGVANLNGDYLNALGGDIVMQAQTGSNVRLNVDGTGSVLVARAGETFTTQVIHTHFNPNNPFLRVSTDSGGTQAILVARATLNDAFANGTVAGDGVIRSNAGDLHITANITRIGLTLGSADNHFMRQRLTIESSTFASAAIVYDNRINTSFMGITRTAFGTSGLLPSDVFISYPSTNKLGFVTDTNVVRTLMHGNGQLSIGTSGQYTTTTNLAFDNAQNRRKIVMFSTVDNAHQFYGFGIDAATLRYQVDDFGSHRFYASTGAASSQQLMSMSASANTSDVPMQINSTLAFPSAAGLYNTTLDRIKSTTVAMTFTSTMWAANIPANITLWRVGPAVTVRLEQVIGQATSGVPQNISTTTFIPAEFRPSTTIWTTAALQVNTNARYATSIAIQSTGGFFVPSAVFSGAPIIGQGYGLLTQSFTYLAV